MQISITLGVDASGKPLDESLISAIGNICEDMRFNPLNLRQNGESYLAEFKYGSEIDYEDSEGVPLISGSKEWVKFDRLVRVELLGYYIQFKKLEAESLTIFDVRIEDVNGNIIFNQKESIAAQLIIELSQITRSQGVGKWNYTQRVEFSCFEYEVGRVLDKPLHWQNKFVGTKRQGMKVAYGENAFYLDNEDGTAYKKVMNGGGPELSHRSLSAFKVIRWLQKHEWKT